jgi:GT2 family glycosyltransferase
VAVIVDGHCHLPDSNYLKNLATAFETSGADSLGRPQPLDIGNPSPFQQAVSVARSSRLGHNPGSDIYSNQAKFVEPQSTAVAYNRSVFHKIGLFDEAFDACEDVEFNERVHARGLTCYFTPDVKIVYDPRSSFRSLSYQLSRYGLGRARLACKHPSSLSLPALVPPLWVVWVFLGGLMSLMATTLGWFWLASIGFYATVLLLAGIILGRDQPWPVRLRIPIVYLGIHFGFAWGFWKEVREQVRKKFRGIVAVPFASHSVKT